MVRDAVVVGINNYQDENLRNLTSPAEDGEAIAQILEEYGEFDVVRRFPEALDKNTRKPYIARKHDFNKTDLEDALVELFKPESKQIPDTALFYFSGHGIRKTKGIQEGFLCTSDVRPALGFNGLSLQWLRRLLQESPIRQQIIILDCCHSGELLNFNEADPGEQGQARDRCFIAASREFEQSFEDLNSSYSVLTKVLLDGLDPNRSPQQWITNYSLIEFIDHNLHHENQRPIFTNFGSPINLTRSWDTKTPVAKGQETENICPYKGLDYFDCNDEDPKYFFGREKLTDKLLDRVRQNNFLAILGASGSGKSSVLRAGLLHQLKLGRKLAGSQDWKIRIMLPGEHPLQSLAFSWLEPNLSDMDRGIKLDQIKSCLKQGSEGLSTLVEASTANRIVLVIDQFEEAFTLCQNLTEREAFFQCLLEALEKTDDKLCLILAMRIDFFGKCFEREYNGLGDKIQDKNNFVAVSPMKREELEQAIIKPAEKVKLSIESGLADEILRDIKGSPGSLPLLQDTLTELWKRRVNNQLKFAAYSQLGGIGGTLNQRATEVYNSLTTQEKDAVKHIFLALTNLGEGTEDTRRRVLKKVLITAKHNEQLIDKVVQKLADARLLITRLQVDRSSPINKEAEVDVAHEALIRNWLLLRQWLEESREQLRERRKIEDAAQEWNASREKTEYLFSSKRLKAAKNFQKEQQEKYPLSELAISFIVRSIKFQRSERIKYLLFFLIIPMISAMYSIGIYYHNQARQYAKEVAEYQLSKIEEYKLDIKKITNEVAKLFQIARQETEPLILQQVRKNVQIETKQTLDIVSNTYYRQSIIDFLRESGLGFTARVSLNKKIPLGFDLTEVNCGVKSINKVNNKEDNFSDFKQNILSGTSLVSISGVNLSNNDLSFIQLQNSILNGSILESVFMSNSNLSYTFLVGADLRKAYIFRADFGYADLSHANLNKTTLLDSIFKEANLQNAEMNMVNQRKYQSNNLRIILEDLRTVLKKIEKVPPEENSSIFVLKTALRNIEKYKSERIPAYSELDLENIQKVLKQGINDLQENNSKELSIDLETVKNDLNTAIREINNVIIGEGLSNIDFECANLNLASLVQSDLTGSNFRGANLEKAKIEESDLRRANFFNANLKAASLKQSDFSYSSLQGADLEGADFKGTNISNANLDGANLTSVKNLKAAQLKLACNWDKAFFSKELFHKLEKHKASDPKEPADCNRWE